MKLKLLAKGVSTFVPGLARYRAKGTGGTDSARYCYSVWARHTVKAQAHGLDPWPNVVAELGPGDSLGIGIAALISGCERYIAFDVVQHASVDGNLKVFDELVELFRARTDIPGNDELPGVKPQLDDYAFPAGIFTPSRLATSLAPSRLQAIRDALAQPNQGRSMIGYKVPWASPDVIEPGVADLIFSQAVLEHIDDLQGAYAAMRVWLKPTGYLSHQVDFRCHGTAEQWNGHWAYSDLTWKLIKGKRPYLLNREPHSTHLRLLEEHGFDVVCDQTVRSESRLAKSDLARRYWAISDEDLVTSGTFLQAVPRNASPGSRMRMQD